MTTLVIGVVLIVGGIAFAAAPFLRRAPRDPAPGGPRTGDAGPGVDGAAPTRSPGRPPSTASVPRPASNPPQPLPLPLAAELEELALDRAMGKLSEGDYERLRSTLLQRQQATPAPASGDQMLRHAEQPSHDAEPQPARAVVLDDEAERLVRAARDGSDARVCVACGPRPEPGAGYCSQCGRALGGCPRCGAAVGVEGARFCDQCGSALDR